MVLVGVYAVFYGRYAAFAVPYQLTVVRIVYHVAQFPHLFLHGFYAVGLLDFQGGQSCESEVYVLQRTAHYESLCQVG